jgi:prepilin-type N-terminal cleavage/methylation domain-containing protein
MNIFLKKLHRKYTQGFTLVEILVVLGLFSSVMTIAAGALFTTQSVNTRLQESQAILDNVNLSVETITRDIRYGSNFHCDTGTTTAVSINLRQNCLFSSGGNTAIYFKPTTALSDSDRVAYYVAGGILYKDEYISGATTTYQITANDITVQSLIFYVVGANTATGVGEDVAVLGVEQHDYLQPLVTLVIAGETKPAEKFFNADGTLKNSTKFTIETSVSSRKLDN